MRACTLGSIDWASGVAEAMSVPRRAARSIIMAEFRNSRAARNRNGLALCRASREAGPMSDLEVTMHFDPDEGIANLDDHLDRLKDAAEAQGFKFDRHAARNELQAATFGKSRPAIARLVLSPTGAMAIEVRPASRPPAGKRSSRSETGTRAAAFAADRCHISGWCASRPPVSEPNAGMMILFAEATKQRRETWRPLRCSRSLGWKWPGNFRPRLVAHGFVAKDDAADFDLVRDPSAAMVGEARVVVADDPGPVEPRVSSSAIRARSPAGGRSRTVVKAVAEAEEASGAGSLHLAGKRGQRRMRIIGRKELPEPREPARLFEVQVGDEQRLLGGPEQRAGGGSRRTFRLRTKREPCGRSNAGQRLILDEITRNPRPTGSDAAGRRRSGAAPRRLRSATPAPRSRPPRRSAPSGGW